MSIIVFDKNKTSLRVLNEAVGIALIETQREETRMRSSARCRLSLKLPTFHSTTALQHCKLISVQGWIEGL